MKQKAYRVVKEDGQFPIYEDIPRRNIFYTRGEAELLEVSIRSYNFGSKLIIEESELTWETSAER